ncbi:hypothetical protein [Shinella sp.]|uniref:hypothetical protein n=1 Tax=Shinella sp. TaxID=1870904 RepID=UPI0028B02C1E|nr:hypothetical protein [Shinella sp.]
MKIRLKAPAGLSSTGIYGKDGKEMPVGEELDVAEEPIGWAGRYDIIDGSSTEGKTPVTNPASAYAVAESSPGWFVVTKDGQPVTKKLRQSDLEGFDAMSEEDKAAFADLQKVEA